MHITDVHVSLDSPLDPEETRKRAEEKREVLSAGRPDSVMRKT